MSALGPSFLTKFIRKSKFLTKIVRPLGKSYAELSGYRAYGLKYDDILLEENPTVKKALSRLPEEEAYARAFRLKRAFMTDVHRHPLHHHEHIKPEEDTRYLLKYVEEIEKENAERAFWDNAVKK